MSLKLTCQYEKSSGKKNDDGLVVSRAFGNDDLLHVEVIQTLENEEIISSCILIDAEQAKRLASDLSQWAGLRNNPAKNSKIQGEI